jgi:lipopolysaccharide export system permease protein
MKKIDWYIIKNIALSFAISFAITTLIMLLGYLVKIYDILFAKGVNISLMGKIFWDTTIFLSIFTIPMALTLSINFTYTQLSANSEIVALRSAGISLKRLFFPAFVFTFLIFAVLFYDTTFLAYKAKLSYKTNIASAFKNRIYVGLKQKIFYRGLNGATLYANKISPDKKSLYGVFYANNNSIITAKEADFTDAMLGIIVNFKKAHIYSSKNGITEYGKVANYKIAVFIDKNKKEVVRKNDTRYMDIAQLVSYYKNTHNKNALYKINKMLVFSLSVFVLSIIGFVFGITLARSGKSAGIIISLSVFFAFYILQMLGESLFKNYGLIWPIWLPDIMLFVFGAYIFYRKSTN